MNRHPNQRMFNNQLIKKTGKGRGTLDDFERPSFPCLGCGEGIVEPEYETGPRWMLCPHGCGTRNLYDPQPALEASSTSTGSGVKRTLPTVGEGQVRFLAT